MLQAGGTATAIVAQLLADADATVRLHTFSLLTIQHMDILLYLSFATCAQGAQGGGQASEKLSLLQLLARPAVSLPRAGTSDEDGGTPQNTSGTAARKTIADGSNRSVLDGSGLWSEVADARVGGIVSGVAKMEQALARERRARLRVRAASDIP
eukprot:COSAG05_NODE_398_length_10293_cov_11.919176_4_plen_154_part_00